MAMSNRRTLCAAVLICLFILGDITSKASQVMSVELSTPNPLPSAVPEPEGQRPEKFLVWDAGNWLLGPDGKEIEYLNLNTKGPAAISPNERWVIFCEYTPALPEDKRQGWLVIQSRVRLEERRVVPLNWAATGPRAVPLWSSDSKRILICEQAGIKDRPGLSSYRMYDMGSACLTNVKLPGERAPSDWSSDCKRVLMSLRTEKGNLGVAWVHIDGSGNPEFLASDQEVAHGARLSPDNRRILCKIGSRSPQNEASRQRLYVIDLATKKRTAIDKLGHTDSFCWSSDGSKVAYTWQMPLRQPEEVTERKAYLITCDPDGGNRKTITVRKYQAPPNSSTGRFVFVFFMVLAWWR
jgi:dipeptidyl aminopeptidase/acylaminoacyl peptidase